ncbi:MAG TPA: hypothetical protein VK988_06455 [Acidimicrobiales bacterium]|nr:hypothetical protein [Acidimicrobiales bacterium]
MAGPTEDEALSNRSVMYMNALENIKRISVEVPFSFELIAFSFELIAKVMDSVKHLDSLDDAFNDIGETFDREQCRQ